MIHNTYRALAVICLFLLSALASGAFADSPLPKGVHPPDTLLNYRFSGYRNYEPEASGLGQSYAYSKASAEAMVYLYDFRQTISDGVNSDIVRKSFQSANKDIYTAQEHGVYEYVSPTWDCVKGFEVEGKSFLCSGFEIKTPRGVAKSFIFMTGFQGKIVKVRITDYAVDFPQKDGARLRATAFTQKIIEVMNTEGFRD